VQQEEGELIGKSHTEVGFEVGGRDGRLSNRLRERNLKEGVSFLYLEVLLVGCFQLIYAHYNY